MQLEGLKRKLKRSGYRWDITPNDEAAVLEGCYFDPAAAERPCQFITTFLRHSKGEWVGQPFELLPWQVDLISRLPQVRKFAEKVGH